MNPALVNEIVSQQKELESLREQLENMMAVVGRVERERDDALKTAQEPVAWMHETEGLSYENSYAESVPLYTRPAVSSDPVAWCVAYDDPRMGRIHSDPSMCEPAVDAHVLNCEGRILKVPLYTAPPSRHLSDGEIQSIWMHIATFDAHLTDIIVFARAVLEKANG